MQTDRSAIDDIPFLVSGLDGEILRMNDAAAKLCGGTGAVTGTLNLINLLSDLHPPDFWEHVKSQLLAKKSWYGDFKLELPGGEQRWVHALLSMNEKEEDPRKHSIIHIWNEVSGQSQTTTDERLIYRAVDVSPDNIFFIDGMSGKIKDFNQSALDDLLYSEEELSAMSIAGITRVHSILDKDGFLYPLIHNSSERTSFETRHYRKDGSGFDVEVNASSFTGKNGKTWIIYSSRDITKRKALENKLREHEQQLENTMKTVMVGSWKWDLVSNRVELSDIGAEMIGFKPAESIPVDMLLRMFAPEEHEKVNTSIDKSFRNISPQALEYKVITPDGKEKQLMLKRTETIFRDGIPVMVTGIMQDITHLHLSKAKEEEQRRKTEELVFQASHQLRAAISTISGIVDVITRGHVTEESKRQMLFRHIQTASAEADGVLRDIVRKLTSQKEAGE